MDYGDAPAPYPTLIEDDGARHHIDPDVFLGMSIDPELNGQPDAGAQGDDNNGTDDEDGVTFKSILLPGSPVNVDVEASTQGLLNAWLDFNVDGDWGDPDEQIFIDEPLSSGFNNLTINVPFDAVPGPTFARFRFSTARGVSYRGETDDGEVEDYTVEIEELMEMDFGDAPDPTYPTLLANNGARHIIIPGVYMGAFGVDADTDGQPDSGAVGDDSDGNDDENGTGISYRLVLGEKNTISVDASVNGYLNAWMDFNGDGDWQDAGEQIFTDEALITGTNYLPLTIPADADADKAFARFRFNTKGGLSFVGLAEDGEVEDRKFPVFEADYGDAPSPYPTLHSDNGARHAVSSTPYLGSGADADLDGQPDVNATGDDLDGNDDENGVVFTSPLAQGGTTSVTVTVSEPGYLAFLNAWIDFNMDGDWADAGEQIFSDEQLGNKSVYDLSFSVPSGAVPGLTFARFRLDPDGGLSYVGLAYDGEVEDYQVEIRQAYDYGDAPDPTYRTLLANDGARHVMDPDIFLGTSIDVEPDGQPDAGAQGDDNNGSDDEDGVTITSSLAQGSAVSISVTASVAGLLNAWMDFNIDGDWDEADEQIFTDQVLIVGANALTINVPENARPNATFARFRFDTSGGLSYKGLAENGEVEDYTVEISEKVDLLDFGDAPDPKYPTLLASNGARHIVVPGVHLGNEVDLEPDGHPDNNSLGDDLDGSDDEDGIGWLWRFAPGESATLTAAASVDGYLNAWIDFNNDGDWADADEQILTDEPLTAGFNGLSFRVPANAKLGVASGRFRFSKQTGLSYDGLAKDGEVEDYQMSINGLDYGDAPAPYPTSHSQNGARHVSGSDLYMGYKIDAEPDGQPNSGAQGDDIDGSDDEDGVTFTSALIPGDKAGVKVIIATPLLYPGILDAWIDFNRDGDWADAGEQIFTNRVISFSGDFDLKFNVPAGASAGTTFARFRLDREKNTSFDGLANDGEVEDYQVEIQATMDFGDAPDPAYPTLLANDGARHIMDPDIFLGSAIDVEPDGQPDAGAQGDDNNASDDEDGVTITSPLTQGSAVSISVTASTKGLLNAWMDFNIDGDWDEADEQIFTDQTLVAGANALTINVPPNARPNATFARFRFDTSGGLSYKGLAENGEVEDYTVEINEATMDFGDAPDPRYPTLLANNGARHVVVPGVYLGNGVDAEPDGQPDADAVGDNLDGNVDEDGVGWTWYMPGNTTSISVIASVSGYLNAWIDFNLDGDWADPDEQIFADEPLVAGVSDLDISVPIGATVGSLTARFRFSTAKGLSYDGLAPDGEVEDYMVLVRKGDYGDAPYPYPTLLANDGPRHVTGSDIYLGSSIDSELDGQPNASATGDDNDGKDDEDGVVFTSALVPQNTATVNVTVYDVISLGASLNAWIDFNRDSDWADPGEQIFTDQYLPIATTHNLSFNVPADASSGLTFARFRLGTETGISFDGFANDGEVEDYQVTIQEKATMDFGDAPDPKYPTLLASNGARHIIVSGVYLGNGVDAESDGQPDSNSWGDDNNGNGDEDGIGWSWSFVPGESATLNSVVSVDGYLNAWIDFNNDGDWADPDEQIFTDEPLPAGVNSSGFSVPASAKIGLAYGRFRFSTQKGLSYDGLAEDGEVEDHQVVISELDYGDARTPYPTLRSQNGARHISGSLFYMGSSIDAETDGQPDSNAVGDDADGNDDEDGVTFTSALTPGNTANVKVEIPAPLPSTAFLNAWVDFNGDGDWADAGEQIFTDQPLLYAGTHNLSFSIPASASSGFSAARFRMGTESGMSFNGLAHDGEVEDYQVEIKAQATMDFGDAPSPYPTLLADDGARHTVVTRTYLGSGVDAESNGKPDVGAQGDDNADTDDEDGISGMPSQLIPGDKPAVTVDASLDGFLNAWIDFNVDGDWADSGEQIFTDKAINFGSSSLSFSVPTGARSGTTFARFRYSTKGGLSFKGLADDGEVEDYAVEIGELRLDFGDAPDSYSTKLASNGARHPIVTGVYMGAGIDNEIDGNDSTDGQGDDNDGSDDEDGANFNLRMLPGGMSGVKVTVSTDGALYGYIDFNRDGDFDETSDYIFSGAAVSAGVNNRYFDVPSSAVPGPTFARLRFSTEIVTSYDGEAKDGEVEDYVVEIEAPGDMDFGDAPAPYPTVMADDGARHVVTAGVYLGSGVDADVDGQPDPTAMGDDMDGSDDDDGVVFTTALIKGNATNITITASVLGYLYAWVDFNIDGDWADQNEQLFYAEMLSASPNSLKFNIPSGATAGHTFARFRFTAATFDTPYDKLAHDGEVEDYEVEIGETGSVVVWPGDTNNDGLVDARDVLPVGIYWGSTGPARGSASSNWEMQLATPWSPEATTYVDANGDGMVDARDVLPIGLNWLKTHPVPAAGPARLTVSVDHSRHIMAYARLLVALDSLPNTQPVAEMRKLVKEVISIGRHQSIPEKTAVFQNYPNPFNPETWVPFQLVADAQVDITIYSSSGLLIRTLRLGHKAAGTYTGRQFAAYWDGKSDVGEEVASGIYFYRIQAGDFSAVRKMILVR